MTDRFGLKTFAFAQQAILVGYHEELHTFVIFRGFCSKLSVGCIPHQNLKEFEQLFSTTLEMPQLALRKLDESLSSNRNWLRRSMQKLVNWMQITNKTRCLQLFFVLLSAPSIWLSSLAAFLIHYNTGQLKIEWKHWIYLVSSQWKLGESKKFAILLIPFNPKIHLRTSGVDCRLKTSSFLRRSINVIMLAVSGKWWGSGLTIFIYVCMVTLRKVGIIILLYDSVDSNCCGDKRMVNSNQGKQ